VVKNIKEQVLLFEANGVIGVGIMPWNRFIAKNYYKKQEMYCKYYLELCLENYILKERRSFMKRLKNLYNIIWVESINFQLKNIYYIEIPI
jgi:hypothetical protein